MVNYKIIGSILMLLGTCIGAGMMALPLAAAQYSFVTTFLFLCTSWLIMTIGSFALLEVNLWMPQGTNLFTMARNILGVWGNFFSLSIYLLLLYSLIAAYISGCSDLLQGFAAENNIVLASWQSTLCVFVTLVSVVTFGIRVVDITNRLLMFIKLIALSLMLSLMLERFDLALVSTGTNSLYSMNAFMVMITAFGFSIILPSIRDYLEDNHHSIILTLKIGCFIPLLIYSIWVISVHGLLPKLGEGGLVNIAAASNPNTELIESISLYSGYTVLTNASTIFITLCAITSFLGVALCLVDFIKDIVSNIYRKYFFEEQLDELLHAEFKSHDYIKNILVYFLSFSIPLGLVLFNPGIFIKALSYAGILVLIFLVFLPLLMLYVGRYKLDYVGRRLIPGGKHALLTMLLVSCVILIFSFIDLF